MLRTICVWTHEWSDMPSRSAWTCAMYHHVRTCSSSLTAWRNVSSLRFPRVGARTFASAIASRGGLRVGPCDGGAGTRSPLMPASSHLARPTRRRFGDAQRRPAGHDDGAGTWDWIPVPAPVRRRLRRRPPLQRGD